MSHHYFKRRVAHDTDRGDRLPRLSLPLVPPCGVLPSGGVTIAESCPKPGKGRFRGGTVAAKGAFRPRSDRRLARWFRHLTRRARCAILPKW
jgi:hypothetical protein